MVSRMQDIRLKESAPSTQTYIPQMQKTIKFTQWSVNENTSNSSLELQCITHTQTHTHAHKTVSKALQYTDNESYLNWFTVWDRGCLLVDWHKQTHTTLRHGGTASNWYTFAVCVCVCVCVCVRECVPCMHIGRKQSWESWLCPRIGTEWHEENGGGWIFEGWGLLLWRPRADWKTCFDMWLLTLIIQLDLTTV